MELLPIWSLLYRLAQGNRELSITPHAADGRGCQLQAEEPGVIALRILCVVLVVSCLYLGCSENQYSCATCPDSCATCPEEPPFQCPSGGVVVIMVGHADDFAEPFESVFPDSNLTRFIATVWNVPLRFLDDMSINKAMGHTFTWTPFELIGAELEIHVRALGDIPPNDRLTLELNDKIFEGETERARWTTTFAILTQTGWHGGEDTTLVLDLDHLPVDLYGRTSVLSYMQDGNLDIEVQDDTGVDYMILRLFCAADGVRATGGLIEAPFRK